MPFFSPFFCTQSLPVHVYAGYTIRNYRSVTLNGGQKHCDSAELEEVWCGHILYEALPKKDLFDTDFSLSFFFQSHSRSVRQGLTEGVRLIMLFLFIYLEYLKGPFRHYIRSGDIIKISTLDTDTH